MTKASDNQFPKVTFLESSAPSTPASTLGYLYEKSDGLIYFKNDGGTEYDLTSTGSGLTDHTHAATGSGANGGGNALDVNAGSLRLPVGTGALTTTEGYVGYQSATDRVRVYDGQRERIVSDVGWTPYAEPIYHDYSTTYGSDQALAANGGTVVIPFLVGGHMLLERLSFRYQDAASARSMEWRLYQQHLNNGNAGENTLDEVAGANGTFSVTGGGPTNQSSTAASAPVYVAPGAYWLAVRNTHASNTFGLTYGSPQANFTHQMARTKTLGSALGTTLDFVAATWSGTTRMYFVRLDGRVFGMTTAL